MKLAIGERRWRKPTSTKGHGPASDRTACVRVHLKKPKSIVDCVKEPRPSLKEKLRPSAIISALFAFISGEGAVNDPVMRIVESKEPG